MKSLKVERINNKKEITVQPFKYSTVKLRKHCAFTLAEVLITLAIIGVVAALTIPTLLAQNQQRAWNTAATVFEKRLEVALRTMNTQQVLAGYKTTEDFVAALSNEMKITKVCKNNELTECVSDSFTFEILNLKSTVEDMEETTTDKVFDVNDFKTSAELGHDDWGTNVVGIQLNNGATAFMAYNPECKQDPYNNQFNGLDCVAAVYDTSGYAQPNTSGKDLRVLNARLTKCDFMVEGVCMTLPFKSSHYLTKSECEAKQSEYGIKYCASDKDYWAGAVDICGGVSNMPRLHNELFYLQRYLYHITYHGSSENFRGSDHETLDTERAAKVGFNIVNGSEFIIWSDSEYTANTNNPHIAYYRTFSTNTYNWYNANKNNSNLYIMCRYK